ncbi:T9SS type A sorting domain-containing protein [Luteibaculum oceani]|uniref:T9SS type A sorting domain-containing protein n=1 Tax=Luteibaculum oceani TaxID=1294296 RepID=UPI0014774E67|nr:T9SS type A sorting domain-containing protein [Luteibaculum oceani]
MKRLFPYLFALISHVVYSQDSEIVKEGNHWVSSYVEEDASSSTRCGGIEEFYFQGDSVIGDSTYAILWVKVWNEYCSGPNSNYNHSYDNPVPEIFGFYYENKVEKKIYMVPNDHASDYCDEGLILVWDELLEVGDTSTTYKSSYGCVRFRVDSIVVSTDSLAPRKKYFISSADNHFVINPNTFFTEGIGPTNEFGGGVFLGFNTYIPDHNRQYFLDCFYQDSVKIVGGDCILDMTTNIEDFDNLIDVVVYPNPAREMVGVQVNGTFDLKVINIHGALIYKEDDINSNLEIDTKSFTNGIYFLIIIQEGLNEIITKKIVVDK